MLGYIIKIVGAVFMFAGIRETETVSKGFSAYRGQVWLIMLLSAGGTVCSLLSARGIINGLPSNLLSIIFGVGCTAAILFNQRCIVRLMNTRRELVNDPSLLDNLAATWRKLAVFTTLTTLCDVLYRLLPQGKLQVAVGTVQIITKVIMLGYVCILGAVFNKIRTDFNIMHPV
jgi:hypothetical protein